MSVVFYISGHGFGHAIRQIEIINTLAALEPALSIVIRTTAPRWLFERTLGGRVDGDPRAAKEPRWTLVEGEVDTGVVQRGSLALDEAETIRRAAAFYDGLQTRIRAEVAFLERYDAEFVVTDAPPLACAAASSAGIRSAVCANFTWDWIYSAYAEHLHSAPQLLPAIRDAYARATAGWRMPLHGGFSTVPSVVDIPFVARERRPDRSRDDVRRALDFPLNSPLALVSFGGYGVEGLPLDRLDCTPSWTVVPGVDESRMYSAGLRYEDVVGAVDVVITKPGYGIIADCIANRTAMLYTSRGRFAEYDVMVAEMPRYLRCRFIDGNDFSGGRWRAALDDLIASPPPPDTPRIDGARVVAEMIRATSRSSRATRSWEC